MLFSINDVLCCKNGAKYVQSSLFKRYVPHSKHKTACLILVRLSVLSMTNIQQRQQWAIYRHKIGFKLHRKRICEYWVFSRYLKLYNYGVHNHCKRVSDEHCFRTTTNQHGQTLFVFSVTINFVFLFTLRTAMFIKKKHIMSLFALNARCKLLRNFIN